MVSMGSVSIDYHALLISVALHIGSIDTDPIDNYAGKKTGAEAPVNIQHFVLSRITCRNPVNPQIPGRLPDHTRTGRHQRIPLPR